MKLKKTLTWAAVLAMAVTPLAAYTAMAEERSAAEEDIPEELVVQGEYDEDGHLRVGDLMFEKDLDFDWLEVRVFPDSKKSITEAVIPSYVRFTDIETGEERTLPVKTIGRRYAGNGLEDGSFEGCDNLKSITIPDTVTTLGYGSIERCTSLTSIRLPKNMVLVIGVEGSPVFYGCTKLASIEVDPENKELYSYDGVLFFKNSDGTARILRYPDGKTDKAYVIPENVIIGSTAFVNSSLTTLYAYKASNEVMVSQNFYKCPNLTDIYFEGTEEEWNSVAHYDESSSDAYKNALKDVTVHFNAKPTDVDPDWTPDGTPKVTKFSDKETGIEVTAASGVLPEGVTFNAKILSSTTDSNKYDLSFTDAAGNEVQPNGSVTVSIPLPADWDTAYAYRVEGGTKTFLPSEIKNGKVVFITDHFSVYMLTTEELDTSDEPATSEPTESESSVITPGDTDGNSGNNSGGNSGNDQANTGIALAIAPAALACVAVIAVSKKRK